MLSGINLVLLPMKMQLREKPVLCAIYLMAFGSILSWPRCLGLGRGGSRILERGGGGGAGRPHSGRPRAKPEPCPENFEHLESLKWHFLHSEKAKCLILQFANNKI